MMCHYFGNGSDALWAEMMWQSLLYDGGIPLILLYIALLLALMRTALAQALWQRDGDLGCGRGWFSATPLPPRRPPSSFRSSPTRRGWMFS